MAPPNEGVNYRLLSKIAKLYYFQDRTQQQIANSLGLSRPKVSRLLQQAREVGVVQISVNSNGTFLELETEIEQRYGLTEVMIVEKATASADGSLLKRNLGAAGAAYLSRSVQKGDVIGVTWGSTLRAMVEALQPRSVPDLRVIQTLGGLGPPEDEGHATELSRRFAQLLGGKATLLPAPGLVGSVETRDVLLSDRYVQMAFETFSSLTTAYVGIGALSTNPVFDGEDGSYANAVYDELQNAGAVGDIAMRFFDEDGEPVQTSLDELTIGITREELEEVPRVVGIAGGPEKVGAINGAVKGGLVDVLITDAATAEQLI